MIKADLKSSLTIWEKVKPNYSRLHYGILENSRNKEKMAALPFFLNGNVLKDL
jgi:hypothetical protein